MYRSKLLGTEHPTAHAERMEHRFRHPALALLAPDAVVVARKMGAPDPVG
jgi:hypothetical protein